ncbi:MAG TPA: M56 family metallopeptidase [Methylomirabilota bacterium]|nr:M56 family metallopeptidase [Methylomirabilota bacterium]
MSLWPTLKEWWQFGGILALELAVIFAIAKLLSLRIRSVQWRRAIWQSAVAAMLIVVLGELNGVRALVRASPKQPAPESQRAVVVTIKVPDLAMPLPAMETVSQSPFQAPMKTISRWEQFARWPALVWLAGFIVVAARILLALLIAIVFRLFCRPMENGELSQRVLEIRRALGIGRHVALIESKRTGAPFTFGIWRPVIVLPAGFVRTFTPEQQNAALAHELAHVAGFDSAWRCLGSFVCALLWWHPCSWLTKRELAYASEVAADNASLLTTNGPNRLAECLIVCAKELRKPALVTWLGMDGGGFRSALGKRVARLLQLSAQEPVSRRVPWYVRVIAPAICCLAVWTAAVLMGNPHPEKLAWENALFGNALAAGIEGPKAKPPAKTPAADIQADVAGLQRSPEISSGAATNTEHTSLEQQAVRDKLRQIRLPEFGPIDNLPLSEVIRQISDEARRRDVEKTGINFFLTPQAGRRPEAEVVDINSVTIRVGMLLRQITLEQALRIVVEAAERPIQFSVEDYGVLITPILRDREPLLTRVFKVDPNTLVQGLKATQIANGSRRSSRELSTTNLIPALTIFLNKAGIDLTLPGKSVFFNDRLGLLMVRATLEDLEAVEKALQLLNTGPQQLTIRVKAVEVEVKPGQDAASWYPPGLLLTNSSVRGDTNRDPTFTTILTDDEFRTLIRRMENSGGTDLLNAPEVTTMSGRQAQIKVVDVRYVVTRIDRGTKEAHPTNTVTAGGAGGGLIPITEPFELGPVVDVIPYVEADGFTIQMTVMPTLKEFLGYEDPATVLPASGGTARYKGVEQPVPLPKFRLRQTSTAVRIFDGQTIMVAAGTAHTIQKDRSLDGGSTQVSEEKAAQYQKIFNQLAALRARESELLVQYTDENPRVIQVRGQIADVEQRKKHLEADEPKLATSSKPVTKALFFFITPRIIDPAGNRIHGDEELKRIYKTGLPRN